jgi:hypothetical protein
MFLNQLNQVIQATYFKAACGRVRIVDPGSWRWLQAQKIVVGGPANVLIETSTP